MDAPRIALFLNSGSNDYQRLLEEDCIAAARRRNASVQVFAANTDHDTQERQIRAALAQPLLRRPTVILVCPVREASLRLVARETVAQGIGWVLLNRWSGYVLALREEFPRVRVWRCWGGRLPISARSSTSASPAATAWPRTANVW